ncbi:MAG TPA: DUF6328 family protein [Candidatus Nanopelagicales bacterium]|nr:DUF6328 family protein [Candidatus Nanopelagicales bacterium]
MDGRGVDAAHDTDRALRELLEETRIAQMGGQIGLGFLLAVAYTPAVRAMSEDDRLLYAWAIAVMTAAVVLLLSPVAIHRLNFGLRSRRRILVVAHVVTLLGLGCLAIGIVLSVALAARIALATWTAWLVGVALALVVVSWLVVPLVLRWANRRDQPTFERSPSEPPRAEAA